MGFSILISELNKEADMAVKKETEKKKKEYIYRITKTTKLTPFLKITYKGKNGDDRYIQFRNCIYITTKLSEKEVLDRWVNIIDISRADDLDSKESEIRKGLAETQAYYAMSLDEDIYDEDDEDNILAILEG